MNICSAVKEEEDVETVGVTEGTTSPIHRSQDEVTCAVTKNEISSKSDRVAVTDIEINAALKRTELQFILTWQEFRKVLPRADSGGRLSSERTDVMYSHFHRQYPTCPSMGTG